MTLSEKLELIPGRVAAGIEYIENYGDLAAIDVTKFDIGSECGCALGQAFEEVGDFWEIVEHLHMSLAEAETLGFHYLGYGTAYWAALQTEWVKQIKEKREARPATEDN